MTTFCPRCNQVMSDEQRAFEYAHKRAVEKSLLAPGAGADIPSAERMAERIAALLPKEDSSMSKLTPRQNEIISETLALLLLRNGSGLGSPEDESELLKNARLLADVRRALVTEMRSVTAETDLDPESVAPSIRG